MGLFDALRGGRKGEAAPATGRGGPSPATPAAAPPRPAGEGAPAWAPRIAAEACRACGTCLDECPTGVFSMGRHDRGARVTHPEDCQLHCDRCATHCPEEGISFPGRGAPG